MFSRFGQVVRFSQRTGSRASIYQDHRRVPLKALSLRAIVCPLGQPNKAIGRESQRESWLPLASVLLVCAPQPAKSRALSLVGDCLRTVLAVKGLLRRACWRALDRSGSL
jgi:hypothetical protein